MGGWKTAMRTLSAFNLRGAVPAQSRNHASVRVLWLAVLAAALESSPVRCAFLAPDFATFRSVLKPAPWKLLDGRCSVRDALILGTRKQRNVCGASVFMSKEGWIRQDGSWGPLHFAAEVGDLEATRRILATGAPVALQTSVRLFPDEAWGAGATPLHIAAQAGRTEIVRCLLEEAKAEVDARTNDGITALYLALQNGNVDVAMQLLASGADVNAKTQSGHTPLHLAAQRGLQQVAETLISHGCNLNARTRRGQSALHLAVAHQQSALTRTLLHGGAVTDTKDTAGLQPLHLAAISGSPEMVFALLAYGAPVTDACARGLTPLDAAISCGAPAVCVEALLYKDDAAMMHAEDAAALAPCHASQSLQEMLAAHRDALDARLPPQATDHTGETAAPSERFMTKDGRDAAYQAALGALLEEGCGGRQAQLSSLLRLGAVQAQLESVREGSSSKLCAAEETLRQAWRLQASESDETSYVAKRVRLAQAGLPMADEGASTVTGLEALSVEHEAAGAVDKAVALWREQGVVVFPALLEPDVVDLLRMHVLEVCAEGGSGGAASGTSTLDVTSNIRRPAHRTLRALRVNDRPEALQTIARKLTPFLDAALQASRHLLLEQAAYRIEPGATEQTWHVDDSEARQCMTLQISLVDTAADQGAFQVRPGTHRCSTLEAYLMWAHPTPPLPAEISIAVPAGSVMCYSPNVVHRGSANTHSEDRLVIPLTLMAAHGRVPTGIPLAILPEDEGKWWLSGGMLIQADAASCASAVK